MRKNNHQTKPFLKIFQPYITEKGHFDRDDYMLLENETLIKDKKRVASIFNDLFINIVEKTTGNKFKPFPFSEEENKIDQIIEHYKNHLSIKLINENIKTSVDFNIPLATEDNILDIINNLKTTASASPLDKVSPKILKLSASVITPPLKAIVNSTIITRKYISSGQDAVVTPLYKNPKNGSRLNKLHFRPVSVLKAFSKIFEKYYQNSMIDFTNTVLSSAISAYRKGHSCHHVLLDLTEEWRKYLDNNEVVGAVLMDLSKAFDCLPHELIIAKLAAYGVGKKTLELIYSYLKGRRQGVKINGFISDLLEILSGVPQGSILGPIIFNLFFSDIIYYIKSTRPHNFADDNNLSAHAKTAEITIEKLEKGANEAVDWLTENEMIANPDKFKAILISKNRSNLSGKEVKIKNQVIETQREVESLGVTIDDKLSFKSHISGLCKSAGGKLNALKRLSSYLDSKIRKYYTNAYVISIFNYSSGVWHYCGLVEIHKMEKIHERSIRFIYNDYATPYHLLLANHGLVTLYTKRLQQICCEIYKTRHNLNPSYINDILEPRPSTYPSRKPNDLYVPSFNQKTFGLNSFRVQGPKVWNTLPEDVKTAQSLAEFKSKIKQVDLPSCRCDRNCIENRNNTTDGT